MLPPRLDQDGHIRVGVLLRVEELVVGLVFGKLLLTLEAFTQVGAFGDGNGAMQTGVGSMTRWLTATEDKSIEKGQI